MCLDSLENAKFLRISNLMKCLWRNYKKNFSYKFRSKWVKVYVQDVIVSSVEVQWYYETSSRTKPREEYWPERIFTGDNLKKLKTINLIKSCSTKLGNKHWYTIKDTNNLMTMKQWRSKCLEAFNIGSGLIRSKNNKGTQNGSSRNVSAVLRQKNERILNKKYEFTLISKKYESKPTSTRTTGWY
eukprot:XP_016658240.1 PREDICTED: uncharacterized protein LOC100571958 isoform X2 [Acyrthosiphon pisum]